MLELEVARNVSVRELFEAKNLARVTEYIRSKNNITISKETILLLHRVALTTRLSDGLEQRANMFVLAVISLHIEQLLDNLIADYESAHDDYFLDRISRFHLEFERIHPFVDGNGL